MTNTFSKRSFFAVSLGTMIEYYDYSILAIFLPLISPLFFPGATAYDSLVKGFYALLIASIARPLGGLFFGHIGDKFGRKKALMCSMYGIAIATILMGMTPSYLSIGMWAGVMLVVTKSVQLFCFGGEYNGAGIYVVEHAQNKNEAFIGSLLTATMLVGSLFSTLIAYMTTLEGMPDWSWRIAFFLGGAIGILGIFYRKNLMESPHFQAASATKHSLKTLIKHYPSQLIAGIFIGGFATLLFTTVITFLNPVLMTQGVFSKQTLMLLQSSLIVIAILTLVVAGKIADRKTPASVMKFGALSLVILAFPLLWIIDQGTFHLIVMAQMAFIIINEILLGPSNACLKNLFPMPFRYRGASLSFTIGLSLIGGLTPVVENYLYKLTGSLISIALWLILIGLGTYVSIKVALQKQKTSLNPSLSLEYT